jgi:hypothetical protein
VIYQSDPDAAPDDDFEPGRLEHLVEGNAGRLLDARRTPVMVVGVEPATGTFVLEVGAFEDAGARWSVPMEDVTRFQFARGSELVDAEPHAAAVTRFDRPLVIEGTPPDPRLARERRAMRDLDVPVRLDAQPCIERGRGSPALAGAVRAILAERDLAEMDEAFARQFVSNPWSGELVKGHAIVAAELGLADYHGKVVRDPAIFDGRWSKARRAEHLLARLALTGELWRRAGGQEVLLYRASAGETVRRPRPPAAFVSATFSRAVADAHFAGGPRRRWASIAKRRVPVERLLMTFWETPALNDPYPEAEAILLSRG